MEKYKIKNFEDYNPELGLLRIASRGINLNLAPNVEDFNWIVSNLKGSKSVILFKWFWQHVDVDNFYRTFIKEIDAENLLSYIKSLQNILFNRKKLHWVEKVNLFHTYGLTRLFDDKKTSLEIVQNFPYFHKRNKNVNNLCDLSAYNVSLMLSDASAVDTINLFNLINDQNLLSDYGLYQIYYYKDISKLLEILKQYLKSSKQVIIPQTIAGIYKAEPKSILLSKKIKEKIHDEILHDLPENISIKLERLEYKK